MKNIEAFFAFARKRHQIYLNKRNNQPPPWTDDPILQKYKFTNVFRELDRTTVWFRENIRQPLRNDPRVLFATVAFRWFNRIETAEIISGYMWGELSCEATEQRLRSVLPDGPWTNGAYIIKTPDGMDKLKGVLWCIENFRPHAERLAAPGGTLQQAWNTLRQYPYLGDFMAYESVTDFRHTYLLENAPDIMTWANPGPGACRGFGRVTGEGTDYYQRTNDTHRQKVIEGMRWILKLSNGSNGIMGNEDFYWPTSWPRWEMREVEHTLCEFDKYERARLGEGRPKQLYRYSE